MKVISIIGGRQHLMKVYALHKNMVESGIDHLIVDIGVYNQPFAKWTYKELALPEPIKKYHWPSDENHSNRIKIASNYLVELFSEIEPDLIIVYGDIDPSVSACYAAVSKRIPIAHIESGLRSFDLNDSEELNRILIDKFSNVLFATSSYAMKNLLDEGFDSANIFIAGNSIIHSLNMYIKNKNISILEDKGLTDNEYVLVTFHREENLHSEVILNELISAIEELSSIIPLVFIQYPDTQKAFAKYGLQQHLNNIRNLNIINTLSYGKYLGVISSCKFVITDSSGIQDEAAYLGKPCIICRKHTHREAVIGTQNNQILVGTNSKSITAEAYRFINKPEYKKTYPSDWDLNIGKEVSSILANRYG